MYAIRVNLIELNLIRPVQYYYIHTRCIVVAGSEPEGEKSEGGEETAAEQGHETGHHHRKRRADKEEAGRDDVAGHGLVGARKFFHR